MTFVKKDKDLDPDTYKVLFVCMGNICRSPAGEGVLESMVEAAGLSDRVEIDSAGTIGYHSGQPADSRMRRASAARGYQLNSLARQVCAEDLDQFDLILTMDEDNYHNVSALADTAEQQRRIRSFCEYCSDHDNDSVPDPYYGGESGFEIILDLLEDGCRGVLAEVENQLS